MGIPAKRRCCWLKAIFKALSMSALRELTVRQLQRDPAIVHLGIMSNRTRPFSIFVSFFFFFFFFFFSFFFFSFFFLVFFFFFFFFFLSFFFFFSCYFFFFFFFSCYIIYLFIFKFFFFFLFFFLSYIYKYFVLLFFLSFFKFFCCLNKYFFVLYLGRKNNATHSYQCVYYFRVSKQCCGCQCFEFSTCEQMLMHMTAVTRGLYGHHKTVCTGS